MAAASHHSLLLPAPQLQCFQWPPQGSLQYMRNWTLHKGNTTFDARMIMQGHHVEPTPLSPKSKPAHLDHLISPSTTTGSETPSRPSTGISSAAYSDDFEYDDNTIALNHTPSVRKETQPPKRCFHCGLPWLDARQLSPSGESSHWFVDIHDGVRRKMAYLFCWRCVEEVQQRLWPSHMDYASTPTPSPHNPLSGGLGREDSAVLP